MKDESSSFDMIMQLNFDLWSNTSSQWLLKELAWRN